MSFSDQLRSVIRKSGISRYRLAQEAGVDQAALSRFLGGTGVTTTTLDALAKVLRLTIEMQGPRHDLLRRYGR